MLDFYHVSVIKWDLWSYISDTSINSWQDEYNRCKTSTIATKSSTIGARLFITFPSSSDTCETLAIRRELADKRSKARVSWGVQTLITYLPARLSLTRSFEICVTWLHNNNTHSCIFWRNNRLLPNHIYSNCMYKTVLALEHIQYLWTRESEFPNILNDKKTCKRNFKVRFPHGRLTRMLCMKTCMIMNNHVTLIKVGQNECCFKNKILNGSLFNL